MRTEKEQRKQVEQKRIIKSIMYKRCLLIHLLFLCFVSFREDGVLDVCVVERMCVDVCVGEEVLRCK